MVKLRFEGHGILKRANDNVLGNIYGIADEADERLGDRGGPFFGWVRTAVREERARRERLARGLNDHRTPLLPDLGEGERRAASGFCRGIATELLTKPSNDPETDQISFQVGGFFDRLARALERDDR